MRIIMLASAAMALASSVPAVAQKDNGNNGQGKGQQSQGNGKGGGKSESKPDKGNRGNGGGKKQDRQNEKSFDRGRQVVQLGNGQSEKSIRKQVDRAQKSVRKDVEEARRAIDERSTQIVRDGRDGSRSYADRDYRGADRDIARQLFRVREDGRLRYYDRGEDSYALIQGCPPGLAKKGNGCLPPGQARKIARSIRQPDRRDYYYNYLGYNPRFQGSDYAYSDGYAYRTGTGTANGNSGGISGLITAFLPLVGGALFQGNSWPQQYAADPVPTYYGNYYGNGNADNYRYADDTLFGVNPQSQQITGIAGLLTGNDFEVGQRVPSGYDVYNVPYDYRDQYHDNAQSQYRYSDGYVYQVDTKTRLIQAAIQLLT